MELLRLERDVNRFRGERDQASAQLVRLQSAISRQAEKLKKSSPTSANQIRGELSEASGKLGSLSEAALRWRIGSNMRMCARRCAGRSSACS